MTIDKSWLWSVCIKYSYKIHGSVSGLTPETNCQNSCWCSGTWVLLVDNNAQPCVARCMHVGGWRNWEHWQAHTCTRLKQSRTSLGHCASVTLQHLLQSALENSTRLTHQNPTTPPVSVTRVLTHLSSTCSSSLSTVFASLQAFLALIPRQTSPGWPCSFLFLPACLLCSLDWLPHVDLIQPRHSTSFLSADYFIRPRHRAWRSPKDTIFCLMKSMPWRCQACIQVYGFHTQHHFELNSDILAKWVHRLHRFFHFHFRSVFECTPSWADPFHFHQIMWHPFVTNTSVVIRRYFQRCFSSLNQMCFLCVPLFWAVQLWNISPTDL